MPPNQNSVGPSPSGLRIAIIGQSAFAADVFDRLRQNGHVITAVFTVPDRGRRPDPLAIVAQENDIPVFKIKTWRRNGQLLPDVHELYQSVKIDLNILPYCTQFIPMEIITAPKYHTICYHPSILPRHRGASSINWTLISGDKEAGLTIFWADDGLDTGPILLQETCTVEVNDTVDSLYKRFLYPVGVTAIARSVDLIVSGHAPRVTQGEKGATYDPMLNKVELQQIRWDRSAAEIHDFIRGMDSVPGAICTLRIEGAQPQQAHLFGSTLWEEDEPHAHALIEVEGATRPAILHDHGLLFTGTDGARVNVKRVKINGRTKEASRLLDTAQQLQLEYTLDECNLINGIRDTWEAILSMDVDENTDFFECGAGSMDVVRLVEEIKEMAGVDLENADVFLAPIFDEFAQAVVLRLRGNARKRDVTYEGVVIEANRKSIKIPCQLFINGEFVNSDTNQTLPIVNPTTEEVICELQSASRSDVDRAVMAAKNAFEEGEWSKISARERGLLLFKLADLMHQHREELATIEAIDSGAVYTLALKVHVGMSVETWRYFAGCTDKIQGSTIPVSNARPNRCLTFTKREPIGVCGLITPWNYPLMMLSWKMAACLAAGNTVVIKPAQVCPLTALKFAELAALAGIPPGVINVLPGTGSVAGQAIAEHPLVRKLGFTGSTPIGKTIMGTCASSNLKKCSLELGGKSPLVIFADCDLQKAVRLGMQSVFFNKGENCIAAGRLFVEASIHDEFVRRVVQETRKMPMGDPLLRATVHGPQNHRAHLDKLLDYVQRGVEEGARLECGGRRAPRAGLFFEPAIFTHVEDHMYIAREESFGPIMIISKFNEGDFEGVLKRANNTEFGLASGVFTKDLSKAMKFAEGIQAGTVFVNTYNKTDVAAPFGGCKQSGFGKDLGQEALNEYLKTKCVTIEY